MPRGLTPTPRSAKPPSTVPVDSYTRAGSTAHSSTDSPPDIAGYRVGRELGRGGMGIVYEAVDERLSRTVALKVLITGLQDGLGRNRVARLRDEAEAVARLHHPNVVQIYEVGETTTGPFLALEFVPGGTLADRLAGGPLSPARTTELVRTLARAVQHAHDRGVIHRDLKPGNVLLGPNGTPKITDFGLAKFVDDDRRRTKTGMLLGTPCYMAPELVTDGPGAATPSADIYALGAVLYECLCGRPPIDGPTVWETLRRVADTDPPAPSHVRPGVPRGLDAVCLKCLAKNPAERYPSAAALADDLDRFVAGQRVRAVRPIRLAKHRGVAVPVGMCVVGLAFGIGFTQLSVEDEHVRDARSAGQAAAVLLAREAYPDAEREFARGMELVRDQAGAVELVEELHRGQQSARRGRLAAELHRFADRLRFGFDRDALGGVGLRDVTAAANALWAARDALLSAPASPLTPKSEATLRTDLLDLALLSADFLTLDGGGTVDAHRRAATRLDEAEKSFGLYPSLVHAREVHQSAAAGTPAPPKPDPGPDATAWELYTAGRQKLSAGKAEAAAGLLRRAADREPDGFWPNYYLAVAAYRRDRFVEAVEGFTACAATAADRRGFCLYNRGLAYAKLLDWPAAERDFDRALAGEPSLAAAALNRGLARCHLGRYPDAVADLELARQLGSPPGEVDFNLAIVSRAAGNKPSALAHALRVAPHDPSYARARQLIDDIAGDR